MLLSDLSGRSNLVYKAREFGIDLDASTPRSSGCSTELKQLESRGYQFEGAEASFELLMQRAIHGYERRFRLIGFRVIDEKRVENEPPLSEATIMLRRPRRHRSSTPPRPATVPSRRSTAPSGRRSCKFFPEIEQVSLLDYKVRVLGSDGGTGRSCAC